MSKPHTLTHGAIPELVSANRIAKELKRTTPAVIQAILRGGIKHEATSGTMKLYPRAAIEQVRAAMRAPNKTGRNNETQATGA